MFVLAAEKSRPVMWDMSLGLKVLWYVLAAISIAVFVYGVAVPIARYWRANRQGLPAWSELPGRIGAAVRTVVSHRTIAKRNRTVGWAHRAIFFGWMTLFAGTVIVALDSDVTGPIFGFHFFHGDFYLFCKAALNLLGTALIAGLLVMMVRRAVARPARLDYTRPDRAPDDPQYDRGRYRVGDWVFVVTLLVIALTGFLLEGVRMAMDEPGYDVYQFGGWVAAQGLDAAGLDRDALAAIRHGMWWFHGVLAITFVAAIPYTKAAHMLSSFVSLVLVDPDARRRLPAVPPERAALPAGYRTIADFSARHLQQLDACTKCGRCHEVCPATATGRPLSPRDVILELHEQSLDARGGIGGVLGHLLGAEPDGEARVIGHDGVRPETVWACMQCNACVAACPVGIEQAPIINLLRRDLVEDGQLAPTLQTALEAIGEHGNSFGRAFDDRPAWTKGLDFAIKDARTEPVEVLWFVGDYASFDERSQEVSRATARLLKAAGVDFGILYDGESNSGNDVRRVGEEGLFESLAQRNIAAIEACDFKRIVTTDPHTLNTLRNEYPQLGGGPWDVVHHTRLLRELIEDGRLAVRGDLGHRVTFHDPCHLGRMNGEYDDPRRILELVGCELVEMPRNRENSFCCGAGGGRIWMPDAPGVERPSENRIHEAVGLGEMEFFVVSCPKDVTMYDDAIRSTGNDGQLALRELTELVEAALVRETEAEVIEA